MTSRAHYGLKYYHHRIFLWDDGRDVDMRYAFEKHILRWILAHYLPCNIDCRVSSKCFFDRSYRTFS